MAAQEMFTRLLAGTMLCNRETQGRIQPVKVSRRIVVAQRHGGNDEELTGIKVRPGARRLLRRERAAIGRGSKLPRTSRCSAGIAPKAATRSVPSPARLRWKFHFAASEPAGALFQDR